MKRKLMWAGGVLLALIIIGAVLGGHKKKSPAATTTAAATTTVAATVARKTRTTAAEKKAAAQRTAKQRAAARKAAKAAAAEARAEKRSAAQEDKREAAAKAADEKRSMNTRSRDFVKQIHVCDQFVALTLADIKKNPSDVIAASVEVSKTKSGCSTVYQRMIGMDTTHFRDQALDAETAVDYWVRGLGRFSNYIDNEVPSDAAKATEYFQDATSDAAIAIVEINERRKLYGLNPVK